MARELAQEFEPSSLVAGDAFFAFLARGALDPWLPEAHAQNLVVVQAAAAATGRLVAGGQSVVYGGVVGPWFLADFAAAAGLAHLEYVVLMPSQERCLARVATRVGHGFTDPGATRRMYQDFARAAIPARHVITDPPDDARQTVALILQRLADGQLRFPGTD